MGIETAFLAIVAAATAVSAYGSIQAGKEAKFAGEMSAQIGEQEAVVQEQQAGVEADAIRDRNDRLAASQRTSFLKSGITLDGTASDVMYDSALAGELEALSAVYRGSVGANFSRKDAAISRYSGQAAARSYNLQAAGSILQGAGRAMSGSASFKKK